VEKFTNYWSWQQEPVKQSRETVLLGVRLLLTFESSRQLTPGFSQVLITAIGKSRFNGFLEHGLRQAVETAMSISSSAGTPG